MEKWDKRFIDLAHLVAGWSKDRSTQVGAVIVGASREVISTGFNGFPKGVRDDIPERHERPAKYLYTVHAETNAIALAVIRGASTRDSYLYATLHPCAACAGLLIQAGIQRIITPRIPLELVTENRGSFIETDASQKSWRASCLDARAMFDEAGVVVTEYE